MAVDTPFTAADAQRAFEAWGANCGPGALAAVLNVALDDVRPHLKGFDQKRYTNPSMMFAALRSLKARWSMRMTRDWPTYGLARVQWEGPWTAAGVPIAARYRHTHWVGSRRGGAEVFDINCIYVGGWVSQSEWSSRVVPWLLRECEPKADGRWHLTHAIEIAPPTLNEIGASTN